MDSNEKKNGTFTYTYSAKQQDEIKRIRQKYLPREEDKMEQLRRLDNSATQSGTAISLAVGILSALIMGTGMSLVMVWPSYMVPGIVIGIVGMIGVGLAFPLYQRIIKKQREKLAPEIKRLSDELLDQK